MTTIALTAGKMCYYLNAASLSSPAFLFSAAIEFWHALPYEKINSIRRSYLQLLDFLGSFECGKLYRRINLS
jgi:hypothetical protein